jgi:hypothetical protein
MYQAFAEVTQKDIENEQPSNPSKGQASALWGSEREPEFPS